jgi:hypothetical protein
MEKSVTTITKAVLLCILLTVTLLTGDVEAEGLQARYLENSGERSVLQIVIEDPAPTSVIVTQRIPQGLQVMDATPAYTKYSPGRNELKWLFKRPSPGIKQIILQLSGTLPAKGLSAVIRCKSPMDGSLMTIRVE